MDEQNPLKAPLTKLGQEKLFQTQRSRGPGRGIGEKRISKERVERLDTIFLALQDIHDYLSEHGHMIINESGSMLTSQSHQNLDQLLVLLEDFLWILNCAIAKNGGNPKIV
ncbi:MAG: hypothetical protein ACFE89_11235 [Candidatus Hodarchaeota archaeon]